MHTLKKNLDDAKGLQAEKLPKTLWIYKMTYKSNTGETNFELAFGVEAVMPVEVRLPSFIVVHCDGEMNEHMRVNLDVIKEVGVKTISKKRKLQEKSS